MNIKIRCNVQASTFDVFYHPLRIKYVSLDLQIIAFCLKLGYKLLSSTIRLVCFSLQASCKNDLDMLWISPMSDINVHWTFPTVLTDNATEESLYLPVASSQQSSPCWALYFHFQFTCRSWQTFVGTAITP